MEDGVWDLSSIAEEDFDQLAVYLVPDQLCDDTTHKSASNRAEASLPRNLILKPSQTLSDVSQPNFFSLLKCFLLIFY
jgi:hypothetical protein